jgi:DNA-binding NtrC family response regulator
LDPSITSVFRRRAITFSFFQTKEVAMERALVRSRKLAQLDGPVLIVGEPGSGKSLLAQAVHNDSPRTAKPLRVLGPGDVGLSDLRNWIFGTDGTPGLLEQADGGSLVLDELQEWPEEVQFLFEQYLDTGEFPAMVAPNTLTPDVRLIVTVSSVSAAQAQIPAGIAPGLYQRLRSGEVALPPLAARSRDLAELAADFLSRFASRQGQAPAELSRSALEAMRARRWYGNLRELDQAMRAATLSVGSKGRIGPEDLPPPLEPLIAESHLPYRLDELERWAYARALRVTSGNRRQSIQLLGTSPATFYRKARSFGLIGGDESAETQRPT